jgi:hypothetical protein
VPDDTFGNRIPDRDRTSRKRQHADHEQRSRSQRVADCLNFPLPYEMAEHLPGPNGVGCPREYPPVVHLLLATLMPVTGSKRSAAGYLADPREWAAVRRAIRNHHSRAVAARLPDAAPTRAQYLYAEKTILAPAFEQLEEHFRAHSIHQALTQGLFPDGAPRNWARPGRHQLLVGDGTVPKAPSKAPSKAEAPVTIDPATGCPVHHRIDPAARLYYENGEDKAVPVRGSKFFFSSGRRDGYWRRVIMSFAHVAGSGYDDEAAIAVRHFSELKRHLPGLMGVIYDGAFRGVHRDTLARLGLLVINKQHGSVVPRHLDLLRFGRCRHDLWTDQGRVAERILLDDGTSMLAPVPITRLLFRPGQNQMPVVPPTPHPLPTRTTRAHPPRRHHHHPKRPHHHRPHHRPAPQKRRRTRLPPRRTPPANPRELRRPPGDLPLPRRLRIRPQPVRPEPVEPPHDLLRPRQTKDLRPRLRHRPERHQPPDLPRNRRRRIPQDHNRRSTPHRLMR